MPLLTAENVTRDYAAPEAPALSVLKGVSLSLDAGETLAVLGPSGSGKSTLLNILGALDRPTAGEVVFDGRALDALAERELAAVRNRDMGFVFQLHHLLPQCTALENVLVPAIPAGVDGAVEDRANRLLAAVGLEQRRSHFPAQLSGGERQRVAVARALINRPKLLLADEPTGSLDGRTAAELADMLLRVGDDEGVAMVAVTHADDFAARLQRVLRLCEGRLEEA